MAINNSGQSLANLRLGGLIGRSGGIILTTALMIGLPSSVGSGGSSALRATSLISSKQRAPTDSIDAADSHSNKSVVEEQIDFIKNTFSLTDEKLAKILGVERKTIHNWGKSNNIPREKARARFFELYVLAKDWLSLAYPTDKMLIATPLSNDLNLLDALASLDKEKVLFIGRYLQRQSEDGNDLI